MIKKKLSSKEKAKLAIAALSEGTNKKKFCAKHGISRSALYSWQKKVLTRLSEELT
jgi:transposase-like protein